MCSKNVTAKNLLNLLKEKVGCCYISDLKYENFNATARAEFVNLTGIKDYSLEELSDAVQYLFFKNISFQTYRQVALFQKNEKVSLISDERD